MSIFWSVAGVLFAINFVLILIAAYRSVYACQLIGLTIGILLTLFLWGALMASGVPFAGVAMFVYYGMVLHAFFHYRHVRQEELRYVLGVAAQTESPLAPTLRAYALERPSGWGRRVWEGIMLNLVILGYYFSWHKSRRFDVRVVELADKLEAGMSLSEALDRVPAVASREMVLAAAVGESTGDLAGTLMQPSQTRLGSAFFDSMPRLAYPLMVLVMQAAITTFIVIFISPKFEKIMADLHVRGPSLYVAFNMAGRFLVAYAWLLPLALFAMLGLITALFLSPGTRWWFPGTSWFYRRYSQGRMLRLLGQLLGAGKTVPDALAILSMGDYLGTPMQTRVLRARQGIAQGQPLAEQLVKHGLMPGSMVALMNAAERAHNLPWALQEMGEHLTRRSILAWQRFTQITSPLLLLALGASVAFIALGVFLPLIAILTELTP